MCAQKTNREIVKFSRLLPDGTVSYTFESPDLHQFEGRPKATSSLGKKCKTVVLSPNSIDEANFEFYSYDLEEVVINHPSVENVSVKGTTVYIRVSSEDGYKPYVSWLTDWQAALQGH